eukprot:SAG22_NODE_13507_length_404_cov_0.796721_1_plen_84_part_00
MADPLKVNAKGRIKQVKNMMKISFYGPLSPDFGIISPAGTPGSQRQGGGSAVDIQAGEMLAGLRRGGERGAAELGGESGGDGV